MNKNDELVKLYTGTQVVIGHIETELKANGIYSIVKDGFNQGIQAGFSGGIPSAIDIFVAAKDLERAKEITDAIIEN